MAGYYSLRKYLSLRGSLIALNVIVLLSVAIIWPKLADRPAAAVLPSPSASPTVTATLLVAAVLKTTAAPIPTMTSVPVTPTVEPTLDSHTYAQVTFPSMVLSLADNGYAHLFVYNPFTLPFARLTDNPWDDIHPALSPDSSRLAFASRRNGYWDLYILDLLTGNLTRLTDTLAYDGAPSWSPDGSWIAFETVQNGSLDIAVISVTEPGAQPILLTDSPSQEYTPSWSPQGRHIAYVSNQDGSADIWSADLDAETDRFTNLTPSGPGADLHPAWSPDGQKLAYASNASGVSQVFVLDFAAPAAEHALVGSGNWPVWSADSRSLAAFVTGPNETYLAAYSLDSGALVLPMQVLPASVSGIAWSGNAFPSMDLHPASPVHADLQVLPPEVPANGRFKVLSLDNVTAPQAVLHEQIIPVFNLLRTRIAAESGWDFLATLENAYVPLTSPLAPGMGDDWLYSGRAVSFSPESLDAGMLALAREDFSGLTYWRVYLKTRFQDGSQGAPLTSQLWDLNARYSGDPAAYDQGGAPLDEIPSGYWLDLTDLAVRCGWQRLPALSNWRILFPGAHFNELVYTGGLQWEEAMLQLFPPEILLTPTQAVSPTRTPTRIPTWYKTRVPTATLTPSITPSPRPTWTPLGEAPSMGG